MDDVQFRLILKDEFSKVMKDASDHGKQFNSEMSHGESLIKKLGIAAAIAFATTKIFEFGKASIEASQNAAIAQAELGASLKSTGSAAGLTTQQLAEQAEALTKHSLFTKTAETNMQSLLLTFTNIKGDTFNTASEAINNMAQKMGGDLQGTVIQVGKALQDPVKGISALHRVGVNFSEAQKAVIASLVATGQTAKAQQIILKELNTEFGGSAEAARKAAPMKVLANQFEELKVKVGDFLIKGLGMIAPYISKVIDYFNGFFDKFSGYGSVIKQVFSEIIDFVKPIFEAMLNAWSKIYNGVVSVVKSLSQFGGMFKDIFGFIKPIIIWFYNTLGDIFSWLLKVVAKIIDVFHTIYVFLEKMYVFTVLGKIFEAIWWAIKKIGDLIGWVYDHTLKPIFSAIGWVYDKIKYLLGIKTDVTATVKNVTENSPLADLNKSEAGVIAQNALGGAGVAEAGKPSSSVTGTKNTVINITIDKLVEKIEVVTNSTKEGINNLGEQVSKVLLGAVNDSQIVAGQ